MKQTKKHNRKRSCSQQYCDYVVLCHILVQAGCQDLGSNCWWGSVNTGVVIQQQQQEETYWKKSYCVTNSQWLFWDAGWIHLLMHLFYLSSNRMKTYYKCKKEEQNHKIFHFLNAKSVSLLRSIRGF